ncbi:MAG: NADH-dependent alcohol dehydrogenase, partial [Marinilabiliales bacterium]
MENFVWDIPTIMHFGNDAHEKIRFVLPQFGTRVLIIRGGESLLKNGVFGKIMNEVEAADIDFAEYSGVKPNPRIEEVREATDLARNFQPDVILAVGGGSVIDSAKAVAAATLYDNDPWDLFTGALTPERAVPIVAVLTLAATGTEMNPFSVVQNGETGLKAAFANKLVSPTFSFLNPSFTVSVPRNYTAYGISDLVAHSMEAYFGAGEASLADRFVVSIIQEAREYGPKLLKEVDNLDLRSRIMYAATCALNEITMFGRVSGDWGVHNVGHVFSLLYDIPHGATLSAVYPAWL